MAKPARDPRRARYNPVMKLIFAVGCIGSWLALASSLAGQGEERETWTRFRGPNGSGVAEVEELPGEFGREQAVLWRTPLPPGHSSPVLSDRHVFLTAVEGEELRTYGLDRRDGGIVWCAKIAGPGTAPVDRRNNAASPTPAVDEEVVVVFFPDVGLLAYDHAGEEQWRLPLGPFDNIYGMGASPILVGDRVLLPCDQARESYFLAVDKGTGEQLWRSPREWAKSGHCTPLVERGAEGELEVILPGSFTLDAYDPDNGQRKWWVGGLSFEMKSVPVRSGDRLFINGYGSPLNDPGNQITLPPFADALLEHDTDGDGLVSKQEMPVARVVGWFEFVDLDLDGKLGEAEWSYLCRALASRNGLLAIRPAGAGAHGDLTASNTVWSYRRSVPQLPSLLVYQDVLYMLNDGGGVVTTFEPATGEVIMRGRLTDAIDSYYASPVAGADQIFLCSLSGIVSVLPAGGEVEARWTTHLDEEIYATPALAEGRIFLRTVEALYCFGLR